MKYATPPGPKGHFIFGSTRPFSQDPPGFLLNVTAEYGDTVFLRLGPAKGYIISHPEHVREVLVTKADKFHKAKLGKSILGKVLGNGLLISDGDFHRRQRSLIQPAFHTRRIESYAEAMVAHTELMMTNWADGQIREIDKDMTRLTMFIVAKTLFGANVAEEAEQTGLAIQELQEAANVEYKRSFSVPMWLPTANNRRFRKAAGILDDIINRIIAERQATVVDGLVQDTGDLLSMLLLAQDENGNHMADRQIRDEAVTLFAAGHETTSNALTWTWYLLGQHPEAEAQLRAELNHVLGGRRPKLADLAALPYTELVIKESMRLYPPAWLLNSRSPIEDVTIGDYTLPAGCIVFISPYQMHRQTRYFPNPARFDPERFRPEQEKELPRYAYIPFGAGPRVCIGNAFAMMEARLVLATVAQRYRLSLLTSQPAELQPQITLSPKNGLRVRLEEISQ